MFSLPFALRKRSKHKGTFYQFQHGVVITPGPAETAVFESELELPVMMVQGDGKLAGFFGVLEPPQVYVNHYVPVSGQPRIAGTFDLQGLIDPNQNEGG